MTDSQYIGFRKNNMLWWSKADGPAQCWNRIRKSYPPNHKTGKRYTIEELKQLDHHVKRIELNEPKPEPEVNTEKAIDWGFWIFIAGIIVCTSVITYALLFR